MSQSIYQDYILKKIVDLIKASNNQIRTYYYGDPLILPAVNYPALMISYEGGSSAPSDTVNDRQEENIVITVAVDARADFEKAPDQVAGINTLYDIVKGRDDNGNLKASSIMYILRHNQALSTNLFIDLGSGTQTQFPKEVLVRGQEKFTREAYIKFKIVKFEATS